MQTFSSDRAEHPADTGTRTLIDELFSIQIVKSWNHPGLKNPDVWYGAPTIILICFIMTSAYNTFNSNSPKLMTLQIGSN